MAGHSHSANIAHRKGTVDAKRGKLFSKLCRAIFVAARNGGGPGSVLYAASKGFVSTATRGWARELAPDRIRVNAVSPGVILTPFHERFTSAEQLTAMQATVPMNRLGQPDECAGTFLYLASDQLSGYVTGQTVEVNGGQWMA